MRMRVITISAALIWLTTGACFGQNGGEAVDNGDGSVHAAGCLWLEPGSGAFGFDSGLRPFDMMLAQGPGQGPGPRSGFGGRHGQDWDERRQHLEQLRILKMLEALNLAEDQEMEFLTSFKAVRKEHSRLNAEKESLVDSLSALLGHEPIDDKAINSVVDRILDIEDQRQEIMKSFINRTRSLLTPEQTARFVVFTERFERELLEQVKSFRDRKGPFPEPPVGEG